MATRDITLDVTIRAKTDDAAKASRALSDVEKEAAKAGKGMHGMSDESKLLDAQLAKSKDRLKELEKALAEVGDDKKLRQAIRSERSWITELEKSAKDLAPVAAKTGSQLASDILSGMSDSFKGTPIGGALIAGLVGIVAAGAPAIGAAVAGAVTGVAGLGGIAGGIFAASKDQNVRDAASSFGKSISSTFFGSGSSFVEPIVESLDILKKDFAKLDLGSVFATVAPYVTEFAHGIGGLAGEFMPHFKAALVAAGPALAEFAHDLPLLGQALGEMLESIANSKGTIEGIKVLFNVVDNSIKIVGATVAWLGDRFDDMLAPMQFVVAGLDKLADALGFVIGKDNFVTKFFDKYLAGIEQLRFGNDYAAGSFGQVTNAISGFLDPTQAATRAAADLAGKIKELDDATRSLFGMEMSVDQANLAVAQGFADLQKNLIRGKANWSDNTQAGRDNQTMLLGQIKTIQQQRDAAIEAAGTNKAAIDKANAAYETQLQKILAIGRAAGDSQAQLQALAGEYDINVVINAITKGAQSAGTLFAQALAAFGVHPGSSKKRAAGGPVTAGQPYIVGEHRPELFVPSSNGYIQPSVPTGGGAGTPVVISFAATGDSLLDAILKQLRKYIHVQGGNVQFALTG